MPKKFIFSKTSKILFVLAVLLALVFLNPKNIFSPFRTALLWVSGPFQRAASSLGRTMADSVYFLGSISEIRQENERLIRENDSLVSRVASLASQRNENENLRKELGLAPWEKFELETAFITLQGDQKTGNWLEIDKGSADGIGEGMPVIVSEGILIGKIGSVSRNTSRIMLLLDPGSFVNAADLDTGSKGIVRGEFGLGIVMDLVDQGDPLNQGDLVATSGLGGGIPKGLLIGRIQEIKISDDKLFQQALLVPRVRYSELETVFVIKGQK